MIQERIRKKSIFVEQLEGIFQAIDESGDGLLSEDEMILAFEKELLQDSRVQAYLESLEVNLPESEALFRLLQNSDGQITYDDFIEGILRCKGPARAMDQIVLQAEVKALGDSLQSLSQASSGAGVAGLVDQAWGQWQVKNHPGNCEEGLSKVHQRRCRESHPQHAQGDDIVPPLPAVLEEKDRDEPEGLRFSHESSHEKVERIQEAAPVTPGKVKLRLSMESSISNMSQDQGTITPMSPMESDAGGVEVARQPTESKSPFARRLAAGRKSVRQHESGELTPKVSKEMGNALVMTLELECIGNRSGLAVDQPMTWDCGDTQLFLISEHIFTWIFAGELALRVYAQRCAYFKDLMNIADTVLVILPMLDLYVFKPLAGFSPNIDILRLLRLGKLVRAVRLMRTLRLFQGLRLLVQACSSFLPSLMWSMALLGV
eukprot:g17738.t1